MYVVAVTEATTEDMPKRRGRRRDPRKEQAIKQAALELYCEVGWSGFTFEAVARRSGIGKPAIYLRWDDRTELLLDSLDVFEIEPRQLDTGDLAGDLRALAEHLFTWWTSTGATAWLRIQLDQPVQPDLVRDFYRKYVGTNIQGARGIVDRALDRGELTSHDDGMVLLEMVNGAIYTRVFNTPVARRQEVIDDAGPYLDRLISMSLRTR